MSDAQSCPQCGSVLSADTGGDQVCPQCGIAGTSATLSVAEIPPPPPIVTSLPPPPPLPTMGVEMTMPYGELQQATIFMGMARALRGIGIGNIVFGFLLMGLGAIFAFSSHDVSELGGLGPIVVLTIFGVFGLAFIAEGIWLIAAPSATGLLVAAISMIVSGLLFMNGPLVLIILVVYGVMLIKRYKKYGPLMAQRPSPAMQAKANELLNTMIRSKCNSIPELIEFTASDAMARRLWRVLLQDDMIILIGLEARLFRKAIAEVYFLPTGGFQIDLKNPDSRANRLKGTFYIGDLKVNGVIRAEYYRQFESWRNKMPLPVN